MIFDPEDVTYLAAPFSDPDPQVSEARRHTASLAASIMIDSGATVFSPLSYEEPLMSVGLTLNADQWYAFDLRILRKCDSLTVLKIPGWEQSYGVQLEINEANRIGIPVRYLSLEDLNAPLPINPQNPEQNERNGR